MKKKKMLYIIWNKERIDRARKASCKTRIVSKMLIAGAKEVER